MGTQQILVIVLSVIIVAVGVTVGIKLFQQQAYNANRVAVANEMQQFIKTGIAYWKTPSTMGGGGADSVHVSLDNLATAMGFQTFRGGPYNGSYGASSEDGDFIVVGLTNYSLVLKGIGKESLGGKRPLVTMKLDLNTFVCKTTYGDYDALGK